MAYTALTSWSSGEAVTATKLNTMVDDVTYLANRTKLLISNTAGNYTLSTTFGVPLSMTGTITTQVANARLKVNWSTEMLATGGYIFVKLLIDGTQVLYRTHNLSTAGGNNIVNLFYVSATLSAGAHTVEVQIAKSGSTITIPSSVTTQLLVEEI